MNSPATYFARIGYTAPVRPTLDVLRTIHRQHIRTIPYENLDIHLGRELTLDLDAVFDKLVTRRRGGWCYEMNSVFAWALESAGFRVRRLSSAVNRGRSKNADDYDHMVLLVDLDQPYLADVGFGNGLLEPIPLREGEFTQAGFTYRLTRAGERWFFHNHARGGAGFDFTLEPREMADYAPRCRWLQTSPESGFVRVAVCHRYTQHGFVSLRGAVLEITTPGAAAQRVIENQTDYQRTLQDTFGLDLGDDVSRLWSQVWQAHQTWVRAQRA